MTRSNGPQVDAEFMTTRQVAQQLGLAVRSVQLMVDRGELQAWRTSGGHRRITRQSLEQWRARGAPSLAVERGAGAAKDQGRAATGRTLLLIEDSIHFQNLVKLLCEQALPDVALHLAGDGIVGLAMAGQLQPDVLLIDILLPGLDGATLINTLRSHAQFARSKLVVLTSLSAAELEPYAHAIQGVPVVHKPRLVLDLPPLLERLLGRAPQGGGLPMERAPS